MKHHGIGSIGLVVAAYACFAIGAKSFSVSQTAVVPGSVVLPSSLQTVLYFGDPYMAANVDSARSLMTGGPVEGVPEDYFDRLHQTVALLNPCHEDNYYIANSILAWAGSVDEAIAILRGASACRFWDEVPPFYLGYNLHFFRHDNLLAKKALLVAADRATDNRVGFLRLSVLYEAATYPDVQEARRFLVSQRDQAKEGRLRELLDQRIARLTGFIVLQDAQKVFEQRYGKQLQNPDDLIARGILKDFPEDRVGLGYVFENGQFGLKEMNVRIGGK